MLVNKVLAATIAILLLTSVVAISAPTQIRILAQEEQEQEEQEQQEEDNGNGGDDAEQLSVSTSVTSPDLVRGNKQTVNIVTNQPEAHIYGYVQYASGSVPRIIVGETDDQGALSYEWRVGSGSTPGEFTVRVIAISGNNVDDVATSTTTFNVTPKPTETPTPEEPTPTPTPTPPVNVTVNVTEPIPTPIPTPIPGSNVTESNITESNVTTVEPATNVTQSNVTQSNVTQSNVTLPVEPEEPVGNVTAPPANETEIIVVPENETSVVTPDNGTDIVPPVNESSVVIPSNETINPEPSTNQSEVIVGPINETEIATPENVTEVEPPIPEEVIPAINDTVIVVPGNETVIAENETASEGGLQGNESLPVEAQVCPPVCGNESTTETTENGTAPIQCITAPCELPEPQPVPGEEITPGNDTEVVTDPLPGNVTSGNGTDIIPEQPIPVENITAAPGGVEENIDNITETIDNAVDEVEQGTSPDAQTELNTALVTSINAIANTIEETVPGLTEEDLNSINLEGLNNALQRVQEAAPTLTPPTS